MQDHPDRARVRAHAFTLVELLVVIGIIALLIGILIPTLSKARENANRAACLSNSKQVVTAILMYCNDNKGAFPFPALGRGNTRDEDWIWFDKAHIKDIGAHGIGPYLSLGTDPKVLYCPNDIRDFRLRETADPYPFSYVMNNLTTSALALGWGSWGNVPGYEQKTIAAKISQVKQSSAKILVYEEDERTLDDGNGSMYCIPGHYDVVNFLALRHDPVKRKLPDVPPGAGGPIPNLSGRGMVGYCDGHADFVERQNAHFKRNAVPDETLLDPSWP